MKLLPLIFAIPALFGGCAPPDASVNKNIDIVNQYVKAVQAGNEKLMSSLPADAYMGYDPGIYASVSKPEYILYLLQKVAVETVKTGPDGTTVAGAAVKNVLFWDCRTIMIT